MDSGVQCPDIDIDASRKRERMMALTYLGKGVRAAANTPLNRQAIHFMRFLGA